jgi:hypothetical protein
VQHPALGAPAGGPLAVRPVRDHEGPSQKDAEAQLELVSPRFTGIVELPEDVSLGLRAGELVRARLMDPDDTVGRRVYQTVSHWVRKKLGQERK